MAADSEDLVLSISADVRQMQRALARITGDTAKTTAALQKHFAGVGDVGGAAFDKVAANANKAAAAASNGAAKIGTAMKASSFQTANVASQLQDIAVQLQAGQSPFTIALQQGTQLNQVLGGSGARGAVAALGGAFASLISPVSLATVGIIALGGAAVQYFTSMLSDGEKSAETLKREADLVRQVAREWGDVLPALKAYADERQKLADQALQKEATELELEEAYAEARIEVQNLNVDVADAVAKLQTLGASATEIVRVQEAFAVLDQAVRDETGGAEAAKAVHDALASAFNSVAIPATAGLADQFSDLATSLQTASEKAVLLRADLAKVQAEAAFQEGMKNSVLTPLDPLGSFDLNRDQTNRANAAKSQFQIEQEALAKSRSKAADEAEREAKAVLDLIEQLEFEQSLIGATNLEREQATALRRAGSAATAEQQEKIKALIAATVAEKEAIKQQEDAYRSLQQIGTQALNSLATALSDGRLEGQELLSILGQIAQQLLSMPQGGLSGILGLLFGGFGGGGSYAGAFGTFTGFSSMLGLKDGGPVRRMASGGFVSGRGGPRSDSIPAMLSNGEFVVNASAASRYGGLLEALNSGLAIPRVGAGRQQQQTVQVMVETNDPMFRARVTGISRGQAQQVTANGLKAYDKGKQRQQMTGG